MTRREALRAATETLTKAGIEQAQLDAALMLFHVTGLTRQELLFDGDLPLAAECEQRYFYLILERAKHIPLQYLTGEQEFMGLTFQVSPAVLIPRQDTECLVEEVLHVCAGKRVLDLCTGSGCIAISVAKLGAPAYVQATDLSEGALAVAKENALELHADVEFYKGNLYEAVRGRFDIIVSNPPYIASAEIESLMPEVRVHEPRMALDGKEDGLSFYRRIITGAGEYLVPGGRIFFEIGFDQAMAVSELLHENGFQDIHVKKDYAGLDRVVFADWIGVK